VVPTSARRSEKAPAVPSAPRLSPPPPTPVVADPQARHFGAALDARGLTPGANPRIGPTRFEEWLGRSVPRG